jgi:hypothetical protein
VRRPVAADHQAPHAVDPGWRTEADEAWLAAHRSDTFGRLRRRMRRLGVAGGAVANAELGPFGGAPRRPALKVGGRRYSTVRFVEHRYAYTSIQVELTVCLRCGRTMAELHRVARVREDASRLVLGSLLVCRACQRDSWMFRSRMPTTARAHRRDSKVVL